MSERAAGWLKQEREAHCIRHRSGGDRYLATALVAEDIAEERATLSPHDRITCPLHRRWIHECVASPSHAIRVTGHCWCRHFDSPLTVALDELAARITLSCARCHRVPDSAANRQVLRSCQASIDAARQDRISTVPSSELVQAA